MVARLGLQEKEGDGLVGLMSSSSNNGASPELRRQSPRGDGVALSAFERRSRVRRQEPDL